MPRDAFFESRCEVRTTRFQFVRGTPPVKSAITHGRHTEPVREDANDAKLRCSRHDLELENEIPDRDANALDYRSRQRGDPRVVSCLARALRKFQRGCEPDRVDRLS